MTKWRIAVQSVPISTLPYLISACSPPFPTPVLTTICRSVDTPAILAKEETTLRGFALQRVDAPY
jgi:hypothetical protein